MASGEKLSSRSLHHGSEKFVLGDRTISNNERLDEVNRFRVFRSYLKTRDPYNLLDNILLLLLRLFLLRLYGLSPLASSNLELIPQSTNPFSKDIW
jgi:hypothetical protein